ncbi:MAG: NAD(P)/FAD-dependent oxidoreductase [Caulobacteraceae bacterium]
MSELRGLRVVVAGAGAIGSVCALVLARRGARVLLADPAATGDNASGVAAGMLAPAAEALLDPKSADHFPLLRDARDAWDRLLPDLAVDLDRSGAILQAAAPEALLARARAAGMALEPIDAAEARRRAPGLAAAGPFLFTPEDWRLEPHAMLAALHAGLAEADGAIARSDAGGLASEADVTVLATGPGGGDLKPIKGQILRFVGAGPAHGPVVRGEGVYVAPSALGAVAGATMEEGRWDRDIDPAAVARLAAGARRLFPAREAAGIEARAGVRAATPDGLPLAGAGESEGTLVARGARRNGWLLAPLIAEVLLDRLVGRPASAAAAAFDPSRFK